MGKTAKQPAEESAALSPIDACLARVRSAAAKGKSPLLSVVDVSKTWTYIDYIDLATGTPCLPLEWLYGCRGMMPGRIEKYDGFESRGKSALLYYKFGMAQRNNAFTVLMEAEKAPPTPTFLGSCGADPEKVILLQPGSAAGCIEELKKITTELRKVDPEKQFPIVIGIDSVSSLAEQEIDPVTGEVDPKAAGGGIGSTAREFSKFFRNNMAFLEENKIFLIGVGQYRSKISTGQTFGYQSPQDQLSTLAEKPWKFHASWRVEMSLNSNKEQNDKGVDMVTLTMHKSKMGRTKGHKMTVAMHAGNGGWDFTPANIQLLFKSFSPFKAGEYTDSGSGYYTHIAVAGGKKLRGPDFVASFYQNQELLMACRDKLRVYGFGLPFESDYSRHDPEIDDDGAEEFPEVPSGL
jgi:hypothetical protein